MLSGVRSEGAALRVAVTTISSSAVSALNAELVHSDSPSAMALASVAT
jgi:hypothetical protein